MFNKLADLLQRVRPNAKAELTPEQEFEKAERLFKGSSLRHAVFHLGCALTADPNRREWLDLLDKIADAGDKPLDLVPLGDRNYVGTVAVRAYLLARLRRWTEALELLGQVAAEMPAVGYLQWAIDWLKLPEAAGQVDLKPIVSYGGAILDRIPEMRADENTRRESLERVPVLIETALRTQPVVDTKDIFAFAVLLKRLGYYDLMRSMADEQFAKHPDYYTANARASVYRVRGEVDAAIEMYREALKYDPHNVDVRLDIGDLYLDHGRYVEAGGAYAEALHFEAEHPWAMPSLYAAQALARGDEASRQRFDIYAEDNPGNQRVKGLQALFAPYFGDMLPSPCEATVNGVIQVIESGFKPGPDGTFRIGLSSLEAPSAILAANLELRRQVGPNCRIALQVTVDGDPDPREPRAPVDYRLWTYDGVDASPAVDPPSMSVATAIRDLSTTQYSANAWFTAGKELGKRLGPDCVDGLLGAMVHPTMAFAQYKSWDWLLRAQYAACFAVAGVDDGWEGSRRREVLLALLNGPMDWTVGAAAVVLAFVVRECPEAEVEVKEALWEVSANGLRTKGYVAYVEPVLLSLLRMPNLSEAERREANDRLQSIWKS